jgi:hypothetical protein
MGIKENKFKQEKTGKGEQCGEKYIPVKCEIETFPSVIIHNRIKEKSM